MLYTFLLCRHIFLDIYIYIVIRVPYVYIYIVGKDSNLFPYVSDIIFSCAKGGKEIYH